MLPLLFTGLLTSFPQASRETASPRLVVLLKVGCPCAQECHEALNALARACRGKIRFQGLADGGLAASKDMVRSADLRFPVLPDPTSVQIRALVGREGLDMRLIDSGGKVVGQWNALDRANVAALVDRAASRLGIDIALDLAPFTVLPKKGCEFFEKSNF